MAYQIIRAEAGVPPLLALAVRHWYYDDEFSDEQVEQTKALFHAVFGPTKPLKGIAQSDALMLHAEDDARLLYVAKLEPERVIWLKVARHSLDVRVSPRVCLDVYLACIGAVRSEVERADSTREELLRGVPEPAPEAPHEQESEDGRPFQLGADELKRLAAFRVPRWDYEPRV